MGFYIGQKVVCLVGGSWQLFPGETGPENGVTYTVRGFSVDRTGILLAEVHNTPRWHTDYFGEAAWNIEYFRPIEEADRHDELIRDFKERQVEERPDHKIVKEPQYS